MKNLTSKAALVATLLTASVMAPAQAEEVSLETYVGYIVSQQTEHVVEVLAQEVANSVEQQVANFSIDSLLSTDKGVPTVTILEAPIEVAEEQ
ncbi:hypothetical protein [Thalassotalea maritima]|uniref:hypothetical protein n=1 Tax=Thalassotalea maritima TaxID=3242416 RepID=UPI003529348E